MSQGAELVVFSGLEDHQMDFADLASQLDNELAKKRDPDEFFQVGPAVFNAIVDNGLHIRAFNDILKKIRDDHMPVTAEHTSGQFIVLNSTPLSTWAVIFHSTPSEYLYLSPYHVLQANIGSDRYLEFSRYACSTPSDFSQLDSGIYLNNIGVERAETNRVFAKNGLSEVLDWQPHPSSCGSAITLRVNSLALRQYEWAFSRDTKRAVGLTPVRSLDSNLTTLLALLAECGSQETVELALPLIKHEQHFVRWSAAKTIAALNRTAGLHAIEALVDDPHLEVRTLARSVSGVLSNAAGESRE